MLWHVSPTGYTHMSRLAGGSPLSPTNIAATSVHKELQRQKIELASQIPEEPPLEHPDTIRLMIKLPAGTRLERRFKREESLKFLYHFVFCHPESPDCFQIVTNFPRRVVPCEPTENNPEPPSFSDFGFGKSEMLFVQDMDA
ncbi:FAS-associated factor 2 [Araneus ventricosus]|uniref:FAS-associated factor 2 n=1 Tax=Araneus ventricosus TaxID=182803 RepID=A0A4Y2KTF9_ARAVE|nr:FAS-associated factor 2 [Araneus ventricosus]